MLTEIPRFHRRARALLAGRPATRHRVTLRRVPRRRWVLGVLHPALHGAARRRGLVLRPGRSPWTTRPATCSRSSTTTGCSPSSARRSGARSPGARGSTSPGSAPPSTRSAPAPRSPRSWRPPAGVEVTDGNGEVDDVRRGGGRHPPRPGAHDARRPDRGAARGARRDALLPQHRAAAHRHVAAAAGRAGARRRGTSCGPPTTARPRHRHLRPDPADAACDTETRYLVTLGGEDLVDPATVIDRMEYEHPLYTPDSVAAQRRLPAINTDADRLRRRLPRLGLPRGRCALRPRGGRAPRPRVARGPRQVRRSSLLRVRLDRLGGLRDHDPAHPAHAVPADLRAHRPHLAGRPRRPPRPRPARPVRGARPPRGPHPLDPRERRGVPRPAAA